MIIILVKFDRKEGATVDQGGQLQRWQSPHESETSSAGERQGNNFINNLQIKRVL